MKYTVKDFFDPDTYTLTYVVSDEETKDAIIIDSVLDYDPASGALSFHSAEEVIHYVEERDLRVTGLVETHAHADHLSAAQYLKKKYPNAKLAIGKNITKVQNVFKKIFGLEHLLLDGLQFDLLLDESESYHFGSIELKAIFTPGHTPACSSYLVGDSLFTGDTIFMPDYGTGRCDFPAGSAADLWESIQKIYQLPEETKIYVGHDYRPGGREVKFQTTVGEEKEKNIQLSAGTLKGDFISFREKRDAGLAAPRLLFPSVQVNIDAGHLPPKDEEGRRFLKIPLRGEV